MLAAARSAVRTALADLPADSLVLVACSGGADSLALAACTGWAAPRQGLRWGVLSVDHGLQPGSAERAAAVAGWAATAGADPAQAVRAPVGRAGGPEAAARTARYAALDAAVRRTGAVTVLLGHTLDDQAETVLLGLARGSGGRSLAGMAAVRGRYRRPLLGIRRSATAAVCAELGLRPWADPHNADPAYARARVRGAALPALAATLGPGVPEALARTAAQLRADNEALDAWADSVPDLAVETLGRLPAAVRTRVLRRAVLAAGVPPGRLSSRHLGPVDALVTNWRGQGPVGLPGGLVAVRRCGSLRIGPPSPPEA